MAIIIHMDLMPITHNGHVPLTPEGQHKHQIEVAGYQFERARNKYPGADLIDIRFGGIPYRGFLRS